MKTKDYKMSNSDDDDINNIDKDDDFHVRDNDYEDDNNIDRFLSIEDKDQLKAPQNDNDADYDEKNKSCVEQKSDIDMEGDKDGYESGSDNDESGNDDNEDYSFENINHLCLAMNRNESVNTIMGLIDLYPMDVKQKDQLGNYPLHIACGCGHSYESIVMHLIELFPTAVMHQNNNGEYPLYIASCNQPKHVILKLIQIFPKAYTCKFFFLDHIEAGMALHYACSDKQSPILMIQKIIEVYPMALYEKNRHGNFPIHSAVQHKKSIDVMKILLDADPLAIHRLTAGNESLLHVACQFDNIACVEYLIQQHSHNILINRKDRKGKTPLHHACSNCFTEHIVKILLQHPEIDVNAIDKQGETPLHKASELPSLSVVQELLDHPLIIYDQKNDKNKTPYDLIKVHVAELVKHGASTSNDMQDKLLTYMKIMKLLEEFPIKRRWQSYCYYFNDDIPNL